MPEDAFLLRQTAGHRQRLVVRDRFDRIDSLRIPVRHDAAGPPLNEKSPALAAADSRRAGGFVGLNEHSVRFQRGRDAHQGACRSHSLAEPGHASVGLLPDLAAELVAVVGDDVRVVELIGRVVTGTGCELCGARDHVVDVL